MASCVETKTNDAKEAFKHWAGVEAPAEIELLDGQYWQSPHFTKEYILYLKLKPAKGWWEEFLEYNSLLEDKENWTLPNDSPVWFKPFDNTIRYHRKGDFDQGSRYFRDTLTGICYIYEIQL